MRARIFAYLQHGNMNKVITGIGGMLMLLNAHAQQAVRPDSLPPAGHRQLKGVTITADAGKRPADNVIDIRKAPMPVTIIDKKTIAMMGSRRLDEVLKEQPGLAVVSDLGAGNRAVGLQMQGFSSEYITVLIDGQPMAGRNDGNFDLSRISIADIERIEIIRGASSSLYGSEALGGVVNIITRQHITGPGALASVRYGTYHTLDAAVSGETPFAAGKGGLHLSGNYYRTNGFNVNPYLEKGSQTAPPYNSLGLQSRARYRLNEISQLHFMGRYAGRHSVMTRDYGALPTKDALDEHDLNLMLALDNRFSQNSRLIGRYYLTSYTSGQETALLSNGHTLQNDRFTEYVHRGEVQASHDWPHRRLSLIGGTGGEYRSTRAAVQGAGGSMYNYFGYVQGSWQPHEKTEVVAGLRYDGNNLYGGKLSPGMSGSYTPVPWLTLKASMGKGFRPPAYRQLYQVFTNAAQGYTVVGANIFPAGIETLKKAGLVQQLWPVAEEVKALEAETSTSWNAGFSIRPYSRLELNVNGFYNSIRHLINTQQVGIKTNGTPIFSYLNISRAFTKGLEAGFSFHPFEGCTVTGGYQLLYAKDRSVIDSIRTRSPKYDTVRSYPVPRASTENDYFGLPNRSRHMLSLQAFYEYAPWGMGFSVRSHYRGRYGFLDTDNNGFMDPYDVYVKSYWLFYASIQKKLMKERLTVQLTMDNIGNYTDYLMPAQAGRMFLAGLTWKWVKN